jgi:holin-like protein
MLRGLTILLVYQLIGEVTVRTADLPLPGPVVGMILLFATLAVKGGVPEDLRNTAGGVLQHLSLLFVPAGTGVMVHYARVRAEWLPIAVALIVSTVLTVAVTALVMQALMRLRSDVAGDGR